MREACEDSERRKGVMGRRDAQRETKEEMRVQEVSLLLKVERADYRKDRWINYLRCVQIAGNGV